MASKNKEEYRKQVARIKRAMSRIRRAGYYFPDSPLPDEEPKRVTRKTIETLEAINPRFLRTIAVPTESTSDSPTQILEGTLHRVKSADEVRGTQVPHLFANVPLVDEETGEVLNPSTTSVAPSQVSTAPIDHKYQAIVIAFKNDIRELASTMRQNLLPRGEVDITEPRSLVFIDRVVAAFGYQRVAQMIEEAVSSGELIRHEILYKDVENNRWINSLESFIQKYSSEEEEIGQNIFNDMYNKNYTRDEIFSAYDDVGDEFEIERS